MKKTNFILLITRVHTLLATGVIVLLASCSKAELQQENNAEPPKSSSIYAVSYDEAVAELNSLLADIDTPTKGKTPRKVANYYTTTLSGAETKSNADDPFIYVFNFENNEGFAILSGDKRTTPVFAITESGSLNAGDTITNPGLGIALMGIYDDIWGTIGKDDEYTETYSPWKTTTDVKNLVKAKWGQSRPYNYNFERYIPTGCVSTAVAQIMYYYGYPNNYGGCNFNWGEMQKHISTSASEEMYDPADYMIGNLFEQLGKPQNLNVLYNVDGNSWAYDDDVSRTFRNFGYSNGGTLRDYSEDYVFSDVAYYKCPVYMGGSAYKTTNIFGTVISYSGGHAWVVDGVFERQRTATRYVNGRFDFSWTQTDRYFWCNWGDNGTGNGYFRSGVFHKKNGPAITRTVGESGIYSYNLKMITGIRK